MLLIFCKVWYLYIHNLIIDPCAGNGDLIKYIHEDTRSSARVIAYDVDITKTSIRAGTQIYTITTQNTLKNPVVYTGSLLMMNPPYLGKNKTREHSDVFAKYNCDDLYKCYINTMLNNPPNEFMIIVPLNFLCALRKADCRLRELFIRKFNILRVNVFNEQVFDDTTYTVCSIHGTKRDVTSTNTNYEHNFNTFMYPPPVRTITISLSNSNKYHIGGEINNLPVHPNVKVNRAMNGEGGRVSNLYLKLIDDNLADASTWASLSYDIKHPQNRMFGKISDRAYAWVMFTSVDNKNPDIINKYMTEGVQRNIVRLFNAKIYEWRNRYNDLCLTTYRNGGRKRLDMRTAFRVIGNVLLDIDRIGDDEKAFDV